MKHKQIIIGLAVLAVLLSVRGYIKISKVDTSAPVISFPDNQITYKKGDSFSSLLDGVKAIDKKDGDVSDTLIVEKVATDDTAKQAIVTYAAVDQCNNLVKANRLVQYNPSSSDEPEETEKPEKKKDSDESEKTEEPLQTEQPVDSSQITEPMQSEEPQSGSSMVIGSAPVLYLKTKTISIKKNDKFNVKDFVAHIVDDEDTEKSLLEAIKVKGSYDAKKEGTYEINLYVIDSKGNESNVEKVTLMVE